MLEYVVIPLPDCVGPPTKNSLLVRFAVPVVFLVSVEDIYCE